TGTCFLGRARLGGTDLVDPPRLSVRRAPLCSPALPAGSQARTIICAAELAAPIGTCPGGFEQVSILDLRSLVRKVEFDLRIAGLPAGQASHVPAPIRRTAMRAIPQTFPDRHTASLETGLTI